jgi:hypothetical protein
MNRWERREYFRQYRLGHLKRSNKQLDEKYNGEKHSKKYYREHREAIVERQKKYKREHMEIITKKRQEKDEKLFRILTPEGQTPRCAKCGLTDFRFFEIHHINGDGREDRQRFNNDNSVIKNYYVKHPEEARQKLQILCYADHKETTQLILAMRKRP